jgi:hypothetical protein
MTCSALQKRPQPSRNGREASATSAGASSIGERKEERQGHRIRGSKSSQLKRCLKVLAVVECQRSTNEGEVN